MINHYDIIIVGGGMVGAALAGALGGSEYKVAVLDQHAVADAPGTGDFDPRVSAITLASRALFEHLGAWTGIASRRYAPVRAMRVWESSGAGAIRFDAAELGEPELGFIIENRVLRAALFERLSSFTNLHVLCPVEIADVDLTANRTSLRLNDGRHLSCSLLVGADGAHSRVRTAAGIGMSTHELGQQAMVATVRTAQPHGDTARQVFLPTGPLAFLPLPLPDHCSIVWSADHERAETLKSLDDQRFRDELSAAFGDSLGEIIEVAPRAAFPLSIRTAEQYVAERVALIGDAAHTVHPLAGQGVNLGFLDAGVLARELRDARRRGTDPGSTTVLRRYERARKTGNLAMQAATGAFRHLFSARWPGLARLAGTGLSLVDRLPPLKQAFMRYAAGLSGERPPLAHRPVPRA